MVNLINVENSEHFYPEEVKDEIQNSIINLENGKKLMHKTYSHLIELMDRSIGRSGLCSVLENYSNLTLFQSLYSMQVLSDIIKASLTKFDKEKDNYDLIGTIIKISNRIYTKVRVILIYRVGIRRYS